EVLEIVGAEPFGACATLRMDEDERVEALGGGPERRECRIVEVTAEYMRADHGAAQAERGHRPFELLRGKLGCLQRHAADPDEAGRVALDLGRDFVVLQRRARKRERWLVLVKEGEHGRRQHL